MLKLFLPILLALGASVSSVVQQLLNANLRSELNSAVWSGLVSYLVGTFCMALLALTLQDPVPSASLAARIPWWAWSGGLFGAIFIAILLIPQLGAATFFAVLMTGQLLCSLAVDHFGVLGVPVHPVSLIRLAGAALLILGVALIRM
jgi:bacterial/archaeal transporter family-2 protein